eukprot:CAMPEP_0196803726 /NCGR_PEP_ID=MMETSP1362-20130617/3204_1 /TAXON_ID=163516 /ORGANISM="Leptocylindrus danicus, Strain CCMP1856" /LENGTH=379 /DNA_ID=CAMNT_0042175525 /DNA_START=453 /DNA_END=1592 /DNA_ORIENTATION=+
MIVRAKKKKRGSCKKRRGKKNIRKISAKIIDIFSGVWNGAVPDAYVIEHKGLVTKEIVVIDEGKDSNATILNKAMEKEEYLSGIKRGKNMREALEGWCYLHSDLDEEKSRKFDFEGEKAKGIDELCFEFEDKTAVVVSALPQDDADRMATLLSKLYSIGGDNTGLGLDIKHFCNSHKMRGRPPRGFMTSFGLLSIIEGGLASLYNNTKVNVENGDDVLFDILGEMEAILHDWLEENHPDILRQLKKDNEKYYGNVPPYADEGRMISPRVVISWMLGNEPHRDPKDNGLSIVLWVVGKDDIQKVSQDNWRFVFQNLSTGTGNERRDTTSIPLFHGIIIIYDGKKIRHATTVSLTNMVNKFGIFHGSTNPQGNKKHNPNKA